MKGRREDGEGEEEGGKEGVELCRPDTVPRFSFSVYMDSIW